MRRVSRLSTVGAVVGSATLLVAMFVAVPSGASSIGSVAAHVGSPTWTAGVEAPGTATLNVGGEAQVNDVSCTKVGDCVAVGTYATSSTANADFVEVESGGTWGSAQEIPGYAALNVGSSQDVYGEVQCMSTGNCTIAGTYAGPSSYLYPFTASETNGTWSSALELTGFPYGNGDLSADLSALSCSGVGDCVVSGDFYDNSALTIYEAAESKGVWGSPTVLGGVSALDSSYVDTTTLSCSSTGNCGEAGLYSIGSSTTEFSAFVATESNGTWGSAVEIPGLATLNVGNAAAPSAISCAGTGDCVVGGQYSVTSSELGGFIAIEKSGTWASAEEVPGLATLDAENGGSTNAVSCSSTSTCVVGGNYKDASGSYQPFVEDETNGTWASAIEVPNAATLNNGGTGAIQSTSCSSPGNCGATGFYTDNQGNVQAFVVNQTAGTWGNAIEIAGVQALNQDGLAEGLSISCASDGSCGLGGEYTDASNDAQAFVANSNATLSTPNAPAIRVASHAEGSITVTLKAAVSNGGDPVTEYEYSLNGGAWIKAGTSSTVTIRHLKAKTLYHVRLRALNTLGAGKTSASVSVSVI
jgi:hypothetical protein